MFWPYKIKTIKLDYNNKSFRIMFGPFDGRYTPHPNSLLYNAIPVFWPFKAFWFFRKTGELFLLQDFPVAPEGHPDADKPRRYFHFNPFHH